jgi:hypothetical protein
MRGVRARLFSHSDAAPDGVSTPVYTYLRTVWASHTPLAAREGTAAQAAQHTEKAQLLIDRNVQVPRRGLVKVDDRYFVVTGVFPAARSSRGTQRVEAEWSDQNEFTVTGEPA